MKFASKCGVLAIVLASCAAKPANDMKAPPGGYSSVGSEPISDAPATSASDKGNAATAPIDGADFVEDSDSVLKDLRPAFFKCDSVASPKTFVPGTISLGIDVGSEGRVTAVTPEDRQGLNDDIVNCLRRIAMGADFAHLPPGKTVHFSVPLMFTRSALKRRK